MQRKEQEKKKLISLERDVIASYLTLSPVNCFEHFRFFSLLNINKSVRQKST